MSRKGALPNIPLHAAQTQIHTHALIPYDCTFSLIEIFSNMCVPLYLAATCGYILSFCSSLEHLVTGTRQELYKYYCMYRGGALHVQLNVWECGCSELKVEILVRKITYITSNYTPQNPPCHGLSPHSQSSIPALDL